MKTLTQISSELRGMVAPDYDQIHALADAIDAHLAKAAQVEAVAEVRHFNYSGIARNGFSQEAVLLDSAPTIPEGTKLYADPPTSSPAQPVEAMDATLLQDIEDYLCDERMPVIDDLHPNDRHCAETHLSERAPLLDRIRAALAHPRPTESGA